MSLLRWVPLLACAAMIGCGEGANAPEMASPASFRTPADAGASAPAPASKPFHQSVGDREAKSTPAALTPPPTTTAATSAPHAPESAATPAEAAPMDRFLFRDRPTDPVASGEGYRPVIEPGFITAAQENTSTFSIDVDTASYSNVRRFLQQGQLPPVDAVRIEEMLNYFAYEEMPPATTGPFSAHLEIAGCPWNPAHRLAKIGLKGREIAPAARPQCNLVFLIDVSGSMNHPKKLPLVKQSLRLLVEQLGEADHIALTVYAGGAGLVLPSTSASRKTDIIAAIDRLSAGGSTNGAGGIRLAYQTAVENKIDGGANRVILCTDGDFNVGVSSNSELEQLITQEAKRGVFLTVLGFGMGNLQDHKLETLADRGNGHYAYIDSIAEARKALVEELSGTLVTIAKDVKIQVEFAKEHVAGYRPIGYENRHLANQDFANDAKDAGEIGAGHTVTALYEIIPKEQTVPANTDILKLRLRFKAPEADTSELAEFVGRDTGREFTAASNDFRFASSVVMAAMLLRNSEYKGIANWDAVTQWASQSRGSDPRGQRAEFLGLINRARELQQPGSPTAQPVPLSSR